VPTTTDQTVPELTTLRWLDPGVYAEHVDAAQSFFRGRGHLLAAFPAADVGLRGGHVPGRSGWVHQELQCSQDGQPDIFRVLR
jgi:hypothetical protein